jgi:hypothetical protein
MTPPCPGVACADSIQKYGMIPWGNAHRLLNDNAGVSLLFMDTPLAPIFSIYLQAGCTAGSVPAAALRPYRNTGRLFFSSQCCQHCAREEHYARDCVARLGHIKKKAENGHTQEAPLPSFSIQRPSHTYKYPVDQGIACGFRHHTAHEAQVRQRKHQRCSKHSSHFAFCHPFGKDEYGYHGRGHQRNIPDLDSAVHINALMK